MQRGKNKEPKRPVKTQENKGTADLWALHEKMKDGYYAGLTRAARRDRYLETIATDLLFNSRNSRRYDDDDRDDD